MKHSNDTTNIVLVHVDDIIIIENNEKIKNIKDYLKNKFDIKDLEKLKYFVRIEIAHKKKKNICFYLKENMFLIR
jgi:inosine/xanthosine triphosphate pyrophosphatase family protein